MVVQIALAAAARIGQPVTLDAEHRATLRALGNLQPLFGVQPWGRQVRAERRLSDAHRNRAIEIGSAPLEERMFLDVQHHVEVAAGPTVGSSLAFTRHTQTRTGVDAGRNAQIDGLVALNASLAVAILATFFDDLASALASWAGAGDGEKSLLIRKLPTSAARLAGCGAGPGLRASAVAGCAELLFGQFDFCRNTTRRLFERQRHVIAQIRAALGARAGAPLAAAKNIFETEKVAEDIVEVLKDRSIEIDATAGAAQTGMAIGVVNLAFFLIAQNAVGFRAFAEIDFSFVFVLGVAVGVPLQSRLAIGGLDFVHGGSPAHTKNFIKIALVRLRHSSFSSVG